MTVWGRQLQQSRFGTMGLLLSTIALCSWPLFGLLESFFFDAGDTWILGLVWLLVFFLVAVAGFVVSTVGIQRDTRKLAAIVGWVLSLHYGPMFVFWGRFSP